MAINLQIQIIKNKTGVITDAIKREFIEADFIELATFRAHLEHIMDETKKIEQSLLKQGRVEKK